MSPEPEPRLTIGELAAAAGMTVRNVRNHAARGLLAPPHMVARTGYYGAEHLERLALIRAMQAEGFNLEAIAYLPGGAAEQLRHIHEDIAHLAPGLRAAGVIDGEAFRRLAAFDRHHEALLEDEAVWSDSALLDDPRWEESRSLASAALAAL